MGVRIDLKEEYYGETISIVKNGDGTTTENSDA